MPRSSCNGGTPEVPSTPAPGASVLGDSHELESVREPSQSSNNAARQRVGMVVDGSNFLNIVETQGKNRIGVVLGALKATIAFLSDKFGGEVTGFWIDGKTRGYTEYVKGNVTDPRAAAYLIWLAKKRYTQLTRAMNPVCGALPTMTFVETGMMKQQWGLGVDLERGAVVVQSGVDCAIACRVLELYLRREFDQLVLITGDGDLAPVFATCKRLRQQLKIPAPLQLATSRTALSGDLARIASLGQEPCILLDKELPQWFKQPDPSQIKKAQRCMKDRGVRQKTLEQSLMRQQNIKPCVFVSGYPPGTTESEIRQLFPGHKHVVLYTRGGKPTGMAKVLFGSREQVADAVKGTPTINGTPLRLQLARMKKAQRCMKDRGETKEAKKRWGDRGSTKEGEDETWKAKKRKADRGFAKGNRGGLPETQEQQEVNSRTVFAYGCPPGTKEPQVRQHFPGCESVSLVSKHAVSLARVVFASQQDAMTAAAKGHCTINGVRVRLELGVRQKTLEQSLMRQQNITPCVFVSGYPPGTTESEIRQLFPGHKHVLLYTRGGKPTGMAKVLFGSREQVADAVKGTPTINGTPLRLQWDLRMETKPEEQTGDDLPDAAHGCPTGTIESESEDRGETADEADGPATDNAVGKIHTSKPPEGPEASSEHEGSDSDDGDPSENPQKGTEAASEDEDSDSDGGESILQGLEANPEEDSDSDGGDSAESILQGPEAASEDEDSDSDGGESILQGLEATSEEDSNSDGGGRPRAKKAKWTAATEPTGPGFDRPSAA